MLGWKYGQQGLGRQANPGVRPPKAPLGIWLLKSYLFLIVEITTTPAATTTHKQSTTPAATTTPKQTTTPGFTTRKGATTILF